MQQNASSTLVDSLVNLLPFAHSHCSPALKSESRSYPPIVEILSSLATTEPPQTRSQTHVNGKRNRSSSAPSPSKATLVPTPLTTLFIDGMDEGQIWEQLDLRVRTICETLKEALDERWNEEDGEGEGEEGEMLKKAMMMIDYVDNEDEEDMDLDELMEQKDMNSEDSDDDDDDDIEESDDDEDQETDKDDGEDEEFGESVEVLRDPSSDEIDEEFHSPSSLLDKRAGEASILKKRKFSELDDDFFDLSLFNAETEEAESRYVSKGSLGRAEDEENDQDALEFVDLFLPVDEPENLNEENLQHEGMMLHQSTIATYQVIYIEAYYKDFFEPPPRHPHSRFKSQPSAASSNISGQVRFHDEVRVKTIKAKGKGNPVSTMDLLDEEDEDSDYGDEQGSDSDASEEEDETDNIVGGPNVGRHADNKFRGFGGNETSEDGREAIRRLTDDLFAEEEIADTGESNFTAFL